MKIYVTDDGAAVDLEHVLVVGEVFEDFHYVRTYMYVLTLAFNSTKTIGYDTEEQARACRAKFINAWKASKESASA